MLCRPSPPSESLNLIDASLVLRCANMTSRSASNRASLRLVKKQFRPTNQHGEHSMKRKRAAGAAIAFLGLITCANAVWAQDSRLPWSSTFDDGTFAAFNGGFRNTTGVTIESVGCQSGRCARAPLVAGTTNDNYGDFHFGDHYTIRGPKLEEVWLRFYSRFDPGITWPNRSQKLAILNLTDGVTSTRHYQVFIFIRPNGDYAVDHSYFVKWQFFGLLQNVGAIVQPRLGQWDKIKLRVRLNTPGVADGVVQMWVNDELKISHESVNIRESTAYGINKLNLSSYSTQAGQSAGFQWWDSFVLATQDPDGTVPRPPTDVRVD